LAARDPAGAPSQTRKWLGRAQYAAVQSWATLKDYAVRVFEKADDDNVFLLASGLTFSVVAAAVPFLFILVSLISLTLEAAAEAAGVQPIEQLRSYLEVIVPVLEGGSDVGAERNLPEEVIEGVVNSGRAIGLIGFVAFVWLSTRLFGSVRAILREIFDLRQSRGVIQGKIFDAQMVLVSSVLVILNIGITIVFNILKARGFDFVGLSAEQVGLVERVSAWFTALAFIFLLFLLLYKYVPARRVPWRMALTAAAFTAVCWELLKVGFAFYLTRIASFQSIYGGIATLVVVVLWFYYLSIVFVLGAEVAQVYEMRRVRRQQIEVLE
jgi:membrane protein